MCVGFQCTCVLAKGISSGTVVSGTLKCPDDSWSSCVYVQLVEAICIMHADKSCTNGRLIEDRHRIRSVMRVLCVISAAGCVYMSTYIVDGSLCAYWEYKLKFIIVGPGNMKLCEP